ncbi:DUF3967 domain-containing protein [Bacillus sp. MUM 116]|uniref:DUF3967 domain-containing protein n=1 Tax=Bacillus sp. MUM 116 TaxID=1678002 RepID=UPI00114D48B2|nr:DUF3967 domain-containing protein [Bacillus sp. MUM 116]
MYLNVDSAAKRLNIPSNTFTRHYLDFEEHGHKFKRSPEGKLMFSEDDIELFKEFLELKNQPKMTKKKAIEQLISTPTSLVTVQAQDLTTLIKTFESKFEELQQQSKQGLQELKGQLQEFQESQGQLQGLQLRLQEFEEQKVSERDEMLMKSIRETMDTKKMLLEIQKQNELIMKEIAVAREENKKPWWRFWK